MQTTQTIAILGATEQMGSLVAQNLATGNYRLLLSDKEDGKINNLLKKIEPISHNADIEPIACSFNACWEADIIITDLPAESECEIAEKIRAVANQKTLIQLLPAQRSETLSQMQALLPHTHIIHVITEPTQFLQKGFSGAMLISNQTKHISALKNVLTDAGIIPASPVQAAV